MTIIFNDVEIDEIIVETEEGDFIASIPGDDQEDMIIENDYRIRIRPKYDDQEEIK